MAVTTIPQDRHERTDWRRVAGLMFLAAGLFDAILMALLVFLWIIEPELAPGFRAVAAVPVLSLFLIALAPFVRNRIPNAGNPSLAVSQATRWWALCALLLSMPALLIANTI